MGELGTACCLIGAGYSHVGGLPLTKDLLDQDVAIVSEQAKKRFQDVWQHYDIWRGQNPERNTEEYLADVYHGFMKKPSPPYSHIAELIAAALGTPRGKDARPVSPRYGPRITQPFRCSPHIVFWSNILSLFRRVCVVTTNYDFLIERCLRHRQIKGSSMPGFHYGGLKGPQIARGTALPWKAEGRQRYVEIKGAIPLFKLHGSLNWSIREGRLELYQDVRAAFRRGGEAAIVPPMAAKEIPRWLEHIWSEAESMMRRAHWWIVCGYSLPNYDQGIRQMLARAAQNAQKRVIIIDPLSSDLKRTWAEVLPISEVTCLPGLPQGAHELCERIEDAAPKRCRADIRVARYES